ncbi:MAG: glycosyltransferase [Flaviramulus sp.]|nr:glycosyltransferase [Flaviramulus sp.]
MILISLIVTVLYLLLIGSFIFGFDRVPYFQLKEALPKTKFSIVIPFRNESENLPDLLKSIKNLDYPIQLFEIIFVDDDSNDYSVEIINKFKQQYQIQLHILSNNRQTNSPKKDAISTAINQAKNDWIITTDADCVLPKYWLDSFDAFIQKTETKCIVAPISYIDENNFLNRFQTLDILSLQGATIGGFGIKKPFLCNGANFAYTKDVFKALNGFEGNTNIASGDDIFFLEKLLKKDPKQLHYLKSKQAVVSSKSQTSWSSLISQRVRWAAKTSSYNNWFGKLTGLIVLLINALIIIGLLLSLLQIFNFKSWIYVVVIKFNIDFYLIYKSATFFNQKDVLRSFIPSFFFYPFFCVYVAFLSVFSSYKWKDRIFKK